MDTRLKIILFSLVPLALSSCDSVRNTLGLDHNGGDEWSVPNSPPLEIPPDYNLTPPKPGAPPPKAVPPAVQAQRKLGGAGIIQSSGDIEKSILEKGAGETTIAPNIRSQLDKEAVEETSTLGKLSGLAKKAKENLLGKTVDDNAKPL